MDYNLMISRLFSKTGENNLDMKKAACIINSSSIHAYKFAST